MYICISNTKPVAGRQANGLTYVDRCRLDIERSCKLHKLRFAYVACVRRLTFCKGVFEVQESSRNYSTEILYKRFTAAYRRLTFVFYTFWTRHVEERDLLEVITIARASHTDQCHSPFIRV